MGIQSQSLADWLSYLERIHPTSIDMGLERVGQVADRLQLTHLPCKVITVGGTNGKGTTCAVLEAILGQAGYQVGVYSSPHLLRYNERVRLDGAEVSDSLLCQAFAAVEAARDGTSLTFFEFGTLAALWIFRQQAPDVVLLEVGLGGRLDATNLVDSDVAVVTSIALDHCDWLGSTRDAIAREKAGIFRAGKPAISGEPEPPDSLRDVAMAVGSRRYQVGEHFRYQVTTRDWCFSGRYWHLEQLPLPSVPVANAATALAALELSGLTVHPAAVRAGLQRARLVGRLQQIRQHPSVVVDVAHNPHAAGYLATALANRPEQGRRIAVVGMLKDKDIAGTLAALVDQIQVWCLADLTGPRAAKARELAACLPTVQGCYDSVPDAYQAALALAGPEDLVIVFGSFYTVADVLAAEQSD